MQQDWVSASVSPETVHRRAMLHGKQTPTHPCGWLSRPPAGDPHFDQGRKVLETIRLGLAQLVLNFGFNVSPPLPPEEDAGC